MAALRHLVLLVFVLLAALFVPDVASVKAAGSSAMSETRAAAEHRFDLGLRWGPGEIADSLLAAKGGGEASSAIDLSDDALRHLSPEMRKSVRSWSERLSEHRQKLDAYRADPDAFDNKGFLRNAPSEEVRQRIIDTRVRHLEGEIKNFEKQISDALRGGSQ